MKEVDLNPLSYCSIPINMFFSETKQKLGSATAFVYECKEKFFLITNWHNVTGIDPIKNDQIGNHGGIPDTLHFTLLVRQRPHIEWGHFKIDLYDENKAKWFIHPIFKESVDVVAIELDYSENFNGIFKPINKIQFDNFKLEVSDDIFILGFPYSLRGGGHFPIWKRGSVATEPDLDYDGLPKFFVDTASRTGMSGSPVIFKRNGIHGAYNGQLQPNSLIGEIQGFVGIYSGKIVGKSNLDAQLGIVWKKEVIEEIIEGKLKDNRSFF